MTSSEPVVEARWGGEGRGGERRGGVGKVLLHKLATLNY